MVTDATETLRVVEKIGKHGGNPARETLHLATPEGLLNGRTLCGRSFDGRTSIPVSSWGQTDYGWCEKCHRARVTTNKYVLSRRRRRRRGVDFRGDSGVATGTETAEE